MAKDNIEKFEKLLASDENLQAKFRAAADAYTGDKKDEQAKFEALIMPLAEEIGLPFTFEEAKALSVEGREVTLDEADAIAGGSDVDQGWSFCLVIGGGDEKDVEWCDHNGEGSGACEYVGIGFAVWD